MLGAFQRNVLQIVTVRYLTSYVPKNKLNQLRNAKKQHGRIKNMCLQCVARADTCTFGFTKTQKDT